MSASWAWRSVRRGVSRAVAWAGRGAGRGAWGSVGGVRRLLAAAHEEVERDADVRQEEDDQEPDDLSGEVLGPCEDLEGCDQEEDESAMMPMMVQSIGYSRLWWCLSVADRAGCGPRGVRCLHGDRSGRVERGGAVLLIGCIVPRPIALVGRCPLMGVRTLRVLVLCGVGSDPMTILFCPANRDDGGEKDIAAHAKPVEEGGTGEFVVSVAVRGTRPGWRRPPSRWRTGRASLSCRG